MKKHNAFKVAFILVALVGLLAACGEKSQEDVVAKLQETTEDLDGYKATAEMAMNTGSEEQTFAIDVWFQKDNKYRVKLENGMDQQESQIILKNDDGVFVLTPALDKSFKFQTEWPDNSSQPYLFQSLVTDVVNDPEATFESTDNHYVFKTKTNYQSNNNLPFQEVYFDKGAFTPAMVKVLDKDGNALVNVTFSNFELDPTFAEDDFSMEKNMEGAVNKEGEESSATEDVEASGSVTDDLMVVYPQFTAGAENTSKREVEMEDGARVILTFEGEKNFTIVEEKKLTENVMSQPQEVNGEIINLGNTIGALEENTLQWTFGGVDYTLASDDLTREEMIQVAQSVQGQVVK